jgi:hypothetical protein
MPSTQTERMNRCLICDTPNEAEAVLCSECSAPMALIREAVQQQREPRLISVLGDSNVGKTVYLGFLLDMLSKRAGDFEAIPKGAYSVNLQQTVVNHLSRRQFPQKTVSEVDQWNWAYFQVLRRGRGTRWFDLVMPDMAGEALAAEVETPQTFRVIHSLLFRTEACLVLVDAAVATTGSPQPDFFGLKLMSYLDDTFAVKRGERIDVPVAIVLCKADYCPECFDNPHLFAETNLNRLWNICQTRFTDVEFFAATVVGALGYSSDNDGNIVPVPLHGAPRGILEPFEWVLSRL